MIPNRARLVALVLSALFCGAPSAWAADSDKPAPIPNGAEIQGTATPNYVEVPDLHLVVKADSGPPYRVLDLVIWIECPDRLDATLLGNQKKAIFTALKDAAKSHNWKEYTDPDLGAELVKQMVRDTLHKQFPNIAVQDVLLQSMIIH